MHQIVIRRINSKRKALLLLMMAALLTATNLAAKAEPPAPIRRAPNFSRMDLSHRRVNLADYRGKVVLLNFWATWCAPCLTEIPRFVA
jgi:thiol-disulfide isomerase/thioredoxin